ncbi:hypothetical protein PV328_002397 [Microctonus aethiopoides]|uniref:Bardet-Biedl syndrome 4 n=2 Tax=Microctonus aethiopoides TaxID=144406 RepID=A0AA39KYI7_9HYME|nr:hypothetical protein PV328_002397 [Microctonus aethiopoides]
MNNNNIIGNGSVPQEFPHGHRLERFGDKPKKGDHKRAVDAYSEAGKMLNSNDWEIHHCLGECYLASQRSEQAMQESSKAVELTNDKIAHIALAKLAISDNKIDQAIQAYKHIIQYCGDNVEAVIQLGFVYLQQNDISRAFQAFGTVLAQSPGNVEAIFPMAYIIQNHQEYDVALSKYKGTTQALSESWQLWNNIGMCFCGKHKFVAAITCLKRAHYLNPMAWQPIYNLGRVLLMTGQSASAAIHLCAAIAATSQNSIPYLLLGLALKKLNDIQGAEQALFKAHSLTPREPIVLINYAIVLQIQNKAVRVAEIISDLNDICTTMNVELQIIQAAQRISRKINQIVNI